MTLTKPELRQQCRAIRRAIEEKERLSVLICRKIETWEMFHNAPTILTYMPIKGEVDLTPLLDRHDKRWVLPRIIPAEDNRMVFHPYDPGRMIVHAFGMLEPDPTLQQIPPGEIDLVLAPGLAFDRSGWRLGYGGGYFDRFLKNFTGITLGVTYHALLLGSLPHTEYDIPLQWIVTEETLFKTQYENQH